MAILLRILSGWKTYTAAAIVALVAANSIMHFMPPEWENTILELAAALGIVGMRHAITQTDKKVDEVPAKVEAASVSRSL